MNHNIIYYKRNLIFSIAMIVLMLLVFSPLLFLIFILVPKVFVFFALFQQNGYNPKKYYLNLKKHYLYTLSTYLEI